MSNKPKIYFEFPESNQLTSEERCKIILELDEDGIVCVGGEEFIVDDDIDEVDAADAVAFNRAHPLKEGDIDLPEGMEKDRHKIYEALKKEIINVLS